MIKDIYSLSNSLSYQPTSQLQVKILKILSNSLSAYKCQLQTKTHNQLFDSSYL
jgi:hypothetical protein